MASVHKINETLARLRGLPVATVESFSRVLRKEGVLPETKRGSGAAGVDAVCAARMLFAVMRGSPIAGASNAIEVGGLVAHSSGGALMEPILQRQIKALGWKDGVTFAEAVGWLISSYAGGSTDFIRARADLKIIIDRYSAKAEMTWTPAGGFSVETLSAYDAALGKSATARMLDCDADGRPRRVTLEFKSPHLHSAKVSFGIDHAANRAAHERFMESLAQRREFDVIGTETVTGRTISALAELYGGARG